jgi:hypothetical protein
MPQKSPRGGAGKLNPHLAKKVEAQEKVQAQDFLNQRSTELDAEIEAMEAKLTSGNAASAAELRESGQVSSSRILNSRSFFSKLKAKMMDNNIDTKGRFLEVNEHERRNDRLRLLLCWSCALCASPLHVL